MYCPECKAEYRPGFTHCTDCDVDLVAELPKPKPEPDFDWTESSHVWTGKDQERCVELCRDFKAKDVPFRVEQSRQQALRRVWMKNTESQCRASTWKEQSE